MNDEVVIEAGGKRDYADLAKFHYRAGKPGVVRRVLRARDVNSGVVGVLVESYPVLNSTMRDQATGGRYRGFDASERAKRINQEMRTIARVIVQPQWRGIGLGVRLVRAALADATTRFTEAFASMGWVHPLFERAGMMRHEPPLPAPPENQLLRIVNDVSIWRVDQIEDAAEREALIGELVKWRNRARGRLAIDDPDVLLREARRALLCPPVYYLSDRKMTT